jgi:hypothetical protein
MKTIIPLFLLAAVMFLVSCSTLPRNRIVGRWEDAGASAVGVFHEDGTVELIGGQSQVSGTYSFITPGKLKIELMGSDAKPIRPHVYEVTISGDKMTWKDISGVTSEFRRVK